KEQCVLPLCPLIHALDQRIRHSEPVHAVPSRRALRRDGNEMQRWLHRRRRIRLLPPAYLLVETREHLLHRILAEHAHALRERVAIERDDAPLRENCAREWRGALYRPGTAFHGAASGTDCRRIRDAVLGCAMLE